LRICALHLLIIFDYYLCLLPLLIVFSHFAFRISHLLFCICSFAFAHFAFTHFAFRICSFAFVHFVFALSHLLFCICAFCIVHYLCALSLREKQEKILSIYSYLKSCRAGSGIRVNTRYQNGDPARILDTNIMTRPELDDSARRDHSILDNSRKAINYKEFVKYCQVEHNIIIMS